jgi:SAM-dependent methyltransferase
MNPGEHAVMAQTEARHWWYQGLRDVIGRTLAHPELALPEAPAILDAGCGTGATLRFLAARFTPSYLGGFDHSAEAIALAQAKAPEADLYVSDLCNPEIRADALDLVLSLDVVCVTGTEAARPGLRRLAERLRPGGLMLLHLPAYDWLFSEHDVAVHTQERFTLGKTTTLLRALGLLPVRASYRMTALFPALVLSRLGTIGRPPDLAQARSDLHREPSAITNTVLGRILSGESRLVARGVRLPFGSSVFAIGRKPGGHGGAG